MAARDETLGLMAYIRVGTGVKLSFDDANTLRRAEKTLHRWVELECGDSNNHASWSIGRDETTNLPYLYIYPHNGVTIRQRIADREAGALKRIADVCKRNGLFFYHQTDPRGCALYVSNTPLTDTNYSNGVACSI